MESYAPFLIPLVKGVHAVAQPGDIQSPLEEEMWLLSASGLEIDWKSMALQSRAMYGLDLLHQDSAIDQETCSMPAHGKQKGFRYIVSRGKSGYFVMEHPSLLPLYDQIGCCHKQPVLARPSVFARWASGASTLHVQNINISESTASSISETSIIAFNNTIRELVKSNPTDWHLEPTGTHYRSRTRLNGMLAEPTLYSLKKGNWLINSVKAACGLEKSTPGEPLDGAFTVHDAAARILSARISMVPCMHGQAMAARFFYPDWETFSSLEDLGVFPHQLQRITSASRRPEGLWIVSGPTGSGKSTTLYALLQMSVAENKKVVTVEDPVERTIAGTQQVSIDPVHGISYQSVLKAFMRQAPDSILIGEIRDRDTAEIALQSAFSGHRILTTLHAASNTGIIRRFQDFQIDPGLIGSAVALTIHQRLVPVLCPLCRQQIPLIDTFRNCLLERAGVRLRHTHRANGCNSCQNGYGGRTGVFKIGNLDDISAGISEFEKIAMQLLATGEIDLQNAVSFLPEAIRHQFMHHNCKDFAN